MCVYMCLCLCVCLPSLDFLKSFCPPISKETIGAAKLANQISIKDGLSIVVYTLVDVGFGNATTAHGFADESISLII